MKHIYVHEMTLDELLVAEANTLKEIAAHKLKPMYVQYDFSNALDARLARIRRRIADEQQRNADEEAGYAAAAEYDRRQRQVNAMLTGMKV